jgi:hypothetical protein
MSLTTRVFLALILLATGAVPIFAQTLDVQPGSERWFVKTSIPASPKKKTITIRKLLALGSPIGTPSEAPDSTRIANPASPGAAKEGTIVTTTAWLHLVALERASGTHRDGDYHIQLRSDSTWGDSCFIVEVPYPPFVGDPALKDSCERVRTFIRDRLLAGNEPGTRGNIMQHRVHVKIKGQLFFDASHLRNDGTIDPRGKQGHGPTPMHSYTAWELHPIISMSFAKNP